MLAAARHSVISPAKRAGGWRWWAAVGRHFCEGIRLWPGEAEGFAQPVRHEASITFARENETRRDGLRCGLWRGDSLLRSLPTEG